MNRKRYPSFKAMVKTFYEAGIKLVPNVKPCESSFQWTYPKLFFASGGMLTSSIDMLLTHPAFERVRNGGGLFYNPISKGPSKQNLWSVGEGESSDGSWVDLSAPEAREWWSQGVQSLI
jgi:alpha-glucosidase (family GH31 glycosyl hydrolase)